MSLALAACGTAPEATATPDAIATEIAKQQIIAAALTGTAQGTAPTLAPPTSTPQPADTPVPTAPPPTEPPPPTAPPEPTQPPPTPTQIADRVLPPIGDSNELQGEVVLPGYTGSLENDTPVFSTAVVYYLNVYDPAYGSQSGAGIVSVDFSIEDPFGQIVQQQTELNVKYCAFGGGEPVCNVWVFAEHGGTWPTGQAVENGFHTAVMIIHRADQRGDVSWRFLFEVQLP
jgi:hypothetical protein